MITAELLDRLTVEATESPRQRVSFDLRNSEADGSQRMLNAIEPGSVLPVHRHCGSSEVVVVLRGVVRWNFYNDYGALVASHEVSASSSCPIIVVAQGQWHSLRALEHGTVVYSTKDGAYEPLAPTDVLEVES